MSFVKEALEAEDQFGRAVPTTSYTRRLRHDLKHYAKNKLANTLAVIPGLGGAKKAINSKPELRELSSEAGFMADWYKRPYGTADKPDSLEEVPWDYIEEFQDEIPFWGLREYWYPALMSDELKHNESQAIKLLGDNIVLFRNADGSPNALENRCPHRGPLLSLGQTNVWEVGTITCRYHGMTFDGKGNCVAFLADGPDSPACAKVKAKAYPAEEVGGVIFVYMGVKEPKPFLESMPHAKEVFAPGTQIRNTMTVPYSHLNQLDNTVDMTHVGCLHRTCYLFGDQKMGGGVAYEELPGDGIYAHLRDTGEHGGEKAIDDIRWFMPNLVHHGEEFMEGKVNGIYFWFVPEDVGSFKGWLIGSVNDKKAGVVGAKMIKTVLSRALQSDALPGMACFVGGDAPMQMSQGRVVRWDQEQLARTDRAVVKVRQMMKDAHKAEMKLRTEMGLDPLVHRAPKLRPAPA